MSISLNLPIMDDEPRLCRSCLPNHALRSTRQLWVDCVAKVFWSPSALASAEIDSCPGPMADQGSTQNRRCRIRSLSVMRSIRRLQRRGRVHVCDLFLGRRLANQPLAALPFALNAACAAHVRFVFPSPVQGAHTWVSKDLPNAVSS